MSMNLYNKRGFVVNGQWYPVGGKGHETTAMAVVNELNWKKEWLESSYNEAQDFLVFEKAAIKLGASIFPRVIVVSKNFYSKGQLENIKHKYGLYNYKDYIY